MGNTDTGWQNQPQKSVNETGYRVLVLDDDPEYRKLQSSLLADQGYQVRIAATLAEALKLQAEFKPQIALIDMILNKENGIDALDKLLAFDPNLVSLIITGQEEIDTALQALRHGASDYLSKSQGVETILEAVKRAGEKVSLRESRLQMEQTLAERNIELESTNQHLNEEIQNRIRAEHSAQEAMQELAKANAKLKGDQDHLHARIEAQVNELDNRNLKYRLLVDTAADGIFIHDEQGQLIEINESALKRLGYSKTELESLTIFDIEQALDKEILTAIWAECRPDNPVDIIGTHQRKDGSTYPVEIKINTFYQDGEKYFLAIARDITKRLNVEMALRESETKLLSIIESSQEGVLVVDGYGNIMHSNQQFQTMWQIPDTLMNAGDDEAILNFGTEQLDEPEAFRDRVKELYTGCEESTEILYFKDGRIFERYTRPLQRIADKDLDARIWVFRDITESEQAAQDLQLYKQMVETTSDPMFAIDSLTSRMIYVNEAAVKHFKTEREEILTWRIPDWDPNFKEPDLKPHVDDIKTTPGMMIETDHKLKTGEIVPVEVSLNLTEYKGRVCHFGFFHNIAERKQKEQELLLAKQTADYANKAKSEFLTRMSHELRTPMNAILGFGQLLQLGKDDLNEEQNTGVDYIMQAGQHLLTLINEVLDISKVDAGEMELSIDDVAVDTVLNSAMLLIKPLAMKNDVIANIDSNACQFTVKADEHRLKQILVNLLSNAVKYNRKGGQVTLACQMINKTIADHEQGFLKLEVSDTGVGIKQEDFERVFEPFQRVSLRGENIEGSGVGLTITKKMVELMGGQIGFDSEYGKGSTFWVELPLAESEAKRPVDNKPAATSSIDLNCDCGKRTILYVEDNATNTNLMFTIMKKFDQFELLTATTAETGIDIAINRKPDFILMDIDLPGMDGFEALSVLKDNPQTARIPVIALSAHATTEHVDKGEQAAFETYLTKPIDIKQLMQTLDKC